MVMIWVMFLPMLSMFTSDNTEITLNGIATHNPERIEGLSAFGRRFGRDFLCLRIRDDRKMIT